LSITLDFKEQIAEDKLFYLKYLKHIQFTFLVMMLFSL